MYRKKIKIDLMVHDLKNPLAIIETGIQVLLKKPEKYGALTEKQKKVLERTLRNIRASQTLVNDLLELGKSQQGIVNLEKFQLSDLIKDTLAELFDLIDARITEEVVNCKDVVELKDILQQNGLKLFFKEELWLHELYLDKAKIKQILRNLLNNAVKYRKTHVELKICLENEHLSFSIKDDGDGIPPAYHEKIFESYFQLDPKHKGGVRGYGLGLAGVMVLVEDMGGKLTLVSEKGKGAEFSVALPLTQAMS